MTLGELYELFDGLRPVRRRAAAAILMHHLDDPVGYEDRARCSRYAPCREALDSISGALAVLHSLPGDRAQRELGVDGRDVRLNLDYEFRELERDLFCLERGMPELVRAFDVPGSFTDELDDALTMLGGYRYAAVFSDRDGTIANYCGRYRSSHQPLYAAVKIARFAERRTRDFFVVTSGPLYGHGLLSLSAFPQGAVHLAGSKGREYLLADGSAGSSPLNESQRSAMMALDERLRELLERPDYRILTMVGSGYQQKFGQLTVSRQDVHRTVPVETSEAFLHDVRAVLASLGDERDRFELDDTGFDIELTLTEEGSRTRGFDKGDGVGFLVRTLGRDLRGAPVLVCGDTPSDLPMLEYLAHAGYETHAVFVAADDDLRRHVRRLAARAVFCSGPDVLVSAMGIAGEMEE